MTTYSLTTRSRTNSNGQPVRLQPQQIAMIEEALHELGEFGEVRLIIERGRLRFLVVQRSIDALKWQPGTLIRGPATTLEVSSGE